MEELMNNFVSSKDLINWQTSMSNSAHQREVADLKAAGLNPILSAHTQGASTPSGASDDLSTLMNAMASSVENTGKAVAYLAKKETNEVVDGVREAMENVMSGFGLRWLYKAGTAAEQALAGYVESHPETFDEKWQHHHPNADPRSLTPEQYQAEKDYRTEKNNQLKAKIKNFFGRFSSAKAQANMNRD